MSAPKFRLDLFLPRGGWATVALGNSFKLLEDYGQVSLQPSGPALAYRVRRARKTDYALLRDGVFQPHPEREGLFIRAEKALAFRRLNAATEALARGASQEEAERIYHETK